MKFIIPAAICWDVEALSVVFEGKKNEAILELVGTLPKKHTALICGSPKELRWLANGILEGLRKKKAHS